MIDKELLEKSVEKAIGGTDLFLVDVRVDVANNIVVELDSLNDIDIDTCVKVSRAIEADFDRDVEDYELEVGSAGLTAPFKVKGQYDKNIGNEVEILTRDGRKMVATLVEAGDEAFTVEYPVKVKEEGKKKPVVKLQQESFPYSGVVSVKYHFGKF